MQTPLKKLRAAIIGYGYMGEIRRAVIERSKVFELEMVCESDPTKLNGTYPFKVVREPAEVVNSSVDVVFICTPNHLIPSLTVSCLEKGKHCFSEKPPGRSVDDILAMRNAEEKNPDCRLMFGFNHRFHPGILKAKKIIASERLGRVLWLRGIYGKSGGKSFPNSWRNRREISGGGILLDQGIHMLDLFNYFCGNFEDVKAFASNAYWGFEIEDNGFVIMKNGLGQNAMLHSSATFWKHQFQIDIGLDKGYLTVSGLLSKSGSYGRETLIVGQKQFEDTADAVGNPSEEITYFDKDLSWDLEVEAFADSILNKTPVQSSSSLDALKVMKIVEKAYLDSGYQLGGK